VKRQLKRAWRIASFSAGAGLAGLGAGNFWELSILQSIGMGATMAVLALATALFFIHAAKGEVPEKDFDTAINSAIETVKSGTKDEKPL
jgi:hypothetical protein